MIHKHFIYTYSFDKLVNNIAFLKRVQSEMKSLIPWISKGVRTAIQIKNELFHCGGINICKLCRVHCKLALAKALQPKVEKG